MHTVQNLPKQKLSMSKKTKEWGKANIDEIEGLVNSDTYNGRSSTYRKQINYDLANGKLDASDFEYVTGPYGLNANDFPAELRHYDILSPKINLLLGEEMKRPFPYRVISVNEDAVTKIGEKRKELLMEIVTAKLNAAMGLEPGGEVPEGMPQTPQEVERYLTYTYRDIREITGQRSLTYLRKQQYLDYKFNEGFKHALIGSEECYYVGLRGGEPHVRVVNPLDLGVVMDPDSPYIEDAIAVAEERWLTPATILDQFHEELSDKQIHSIETNSGRSQGFGQDAPEINYPSSEIRIQGTDAYNASNGSRRTKGTDGTIRVLHCEWRSMKKVGFISYTDETGEHVEDIVDEEFKVPEGASKKKNEFGRTTYMFDMGETNMELTWEWISEVWEGTKIGDDIYLGIQAKPNQRRSMDNPSLCKLGYIGYIYNAMNSEAVSLIDRMKTFQYLYNIIYYRLELAIAKSKGRMALMDIAQIPASEGWDIDKWMYYMDAMGVMFINSQEEGKRGQNPQFNQFQSVDLTMGNVINQYVMMLESIKEQLGELSGVSRQRQGQISSSEMVGNVERATIQSSHITEYWFNFHNEVKRRVLEGLLDVSKIAWKNGKKINYIMDDMSRVFINIDGDEYSASEYGVYIANSTKEEQSIESLKALAQPALQSGVIQLSDVASIMMSDSVADIKNKLKKAEADVQMMQQQQRQQEQEAQMQMQQQQIQAEERKQQREDYHKEADRQNKIDVALINAASKQEDGNEEVDKVKQDLDREKLALEKRKHEDTMDLKEKELSLKRSQANAKKSEK